MLLCSLQRITLGERQTGEALLSPLPTPGYVMQLSASSHAVMAASKQLFSMCSNVVRVAVKHLTSSSDSSSVSSFEATADLAAASALCFLAGGPALAAAFLAAASLAAASLAAWAAAAAALSSSACRYQARVGGQHTFLMQQQRQCMAVQLAPC